MSPFIPHTEQDIKHMLSAIGVTSVEELFADIKQEHRPKSFDIPSGKSEYELFSYFNKLAGKNKCELIPFIGGGYYDHYIPAAVTAIVSRSEFYTAYTPYQPECSQGILQALFEYQTAICALTGMEVSNASVYDGGTALYEAVMMACSITKRRKVILDRGVNPIYRKILATYTKNLSYEFVETQLAHGRADRDNINDMLDNDTAAVILQNPNFFGAVDDHSDIVQFAHKRGTLVIESVYPISLGILKTPAEMGVDIVTGDGQSLGLPLNFGGPYLGFMATKKEYVRKMPGRIVGETIDKHGQRCFVNTLQAREQHIRREKATSNICTNSALCAVQALVYMCLLGRDGFKELARLNMSKVAFARKLIDEIDEVEVKKNAPIFNEFTVRLPKDASDVVGAMIDKGFAAGFPLGRYYPEMKEYMIVAVTERRTKEEIIKYVNSLKEVLAK